ncbi:hypothetical protein JYG30_17040 [Fibrella sp. USSR17]
MMKLIYEESPRRFGILLDKLIAGNGEIIVGPTFEQQRKYGQSVPDLVITQQAFTIAFETKITDWFYSEQIIRHTRELKKNDGTLILFLLGNFESDPLERFHAEVIQAATDKIHVAAITYETLLSAFEAACTTDYLTGLLGEFRTFLDSENLLPTWKYLMDVVNCGNTLHEIDAGAYMCPDTGGPYNHKRARILGAYANKQVSQLFNIDAVVVVGVDQEVVKVKWINQPDQDTQSAIDRATALVRQLRPEQSKQIPLQVFLLNDRVETQFVKASPGGMLGSKQYFWHTKFGTETMREIAQFLREMETWEKFKRSLLIN